ncbi:putative deacetylase LmbE-like domain-containing protein [Aspergillus varians]
MKLPTIFITLGLLLPPVLGDRTLSVVAHPDDDFLFLNPDILNDINKGFAVRTVYVTAGDAGQSSEYWRSRQVGAQAAYAQIAGVVNAWDESDAGVPGKNIPLYTLRGKPEVSLAFLHLPDGSMDGAGFASTGQESLEKLWKGQIGRIRTVDGSGATYSKQGLIDALTYIIKDYGPDSLNSLDYLHEYGTGDHSDHTTVGLLTHAAATPSTFPGSVVAYRGYPIKLEQPNVGGTDLAKKKEAFYTYAGYDESVCASDQACVGKEYELWLQRMYTSN